MMVSSISMATTGLMTTMAIPVEWLWQPRQYKYERE